MSTQVLRLPLQLAVSGMRLAAPVALPSGMVVVQNDTVLTPELLERLESMDDVASISVVAQGPWLRVLAESAVCRAENRRLANMFRYHDQDDWMRQVRSVLVAYMGLAAMCEEDCGAEAGQAVAGGQA